MANLIRQQLLKDYVDFKTGKLDSNAAVDNGMYPFFTCSRETFKTNTFAFDQKAVLLAGNNAAGIFPIKYFEGKFDAYQRTYVITSKDPDETNIRYVYYALIPLLGSFKTMSTGTTTKFLTKTILDRVEIPLPAKSHQDQVADILSAYDDSIENNSKRIEKLEAMARLLYRHYFEVPEASDWEIVKIGDILGKAPSSAKLQKGEYLDEGTYPVIDQGKEYIAGYTNKQEAVIADKLPLTVFGDHTRAVKLTHDPFARGADGTQIVVSDILPPYYLYQTIKDLPLSSEHYARHFKLLKATEIARPPENILSEFEEKVEPIFKLINTLTKRNRKLAKARDLLLPRLMSGEIKV